MQIFLLNKNISIAVKELCDAHIVVSSKELMQILSTVWYVCDRDKFTKYLAEGKLVNQWTVLSHPSIRWAMASLENYWFVVGYLAELFEEFELRRKKQHTYHKHMYSFVNEFGDPTLPMVNETKAKEENWRFNIKYDDVVPMSKTYQAIKNQVLKSDDPVISYRRYYIVDKAYFAKWTWLRPMPEWFKQRNEYYNHTW